MVQRSQCATLILLLLTAAARAQGQPDEQYELFEKKIRPVLVKHCYECHSANSSTLQGGLHVDTAAGLRKGGDSGPAIVPGQPEQSLLLQALRHESLEMPPKERLPDDVLADFDRWIAEGAHDPRVPTDPSQAAAQAWEDLYQQRSQWWSLQPVVDATPPELDDSLLSERFSAHPIDRFIAAQLQARSLTPAPRAERTILIRRLCFALTGLPPKPQEIEHFLEDDAPHAWERLVDYYLASPHFGERWARHWMDVVRYTDTYGYEWDIPAKGAWRYRDYLIRAMNADVPFDQLIREHIAGDLLEQPRIDPRAGINESLIGAMFFQMGEKRHGDSAEFNGIHQEMLDNKIDAFSKAFQATTVACARCHDHKLDAITQREYYALAGVFMSSRWVTSTLDLAERDAALRQELVELKGQLRAVLADDWRAQLDALTARLITASQETLLRPEQAAAAEPAAETNPPSEPLAKQLASYKEAPPPEDLWHPWWQLCQAAHSGSDVTACWQTLVDQYNDLQRGRAEQNARDYTVAADLAHGKVPAGWSTDGVGVRQSVACGDFVVALEGTAAISQLLPAGLFTHALSPRMNGALRTPLLNTFTHGYMSFEYIGGDFAAHRTVVDNAFLTERQQYLNQPRLGWLTLPIPTSLSQHRVYFELATKTSNPNFPPRVGLGGPCSEEQAADPRSWFGVTRVVLHNTPAPPLDELSRFAALFEQPPPTELHQAAGHYAQWLRAAVDAWQTGQATPQHVKLLNTLLEQQILNNDFAPSTEAGKLVEQYRAVERQLATPATVNSMEDVDPGCDYALNVRGDYDSLGEAVPRGYLRMIDASATQFSEPQSGRLQLAELIATADNPLTARVLVNRVWYWLFGTGLVRTTDDFGHLGDQPSHPELLDYLAHRFVTEGWSLKKLIRAIVLTETWQQSGEAPAAALMVDPENRLWHHFPLRRLEAEPIRDSMLSVSGRLDHRLYGPPINPFRQNEDPQKRLFSGPWDGEGRRSVYIKITIMEPPKLLATFNQPEPKIPTGRRDVTTTPAQSLALLNDPLVSQLAGHWAARLITEPDASAADRITRMFLTALGRRPTEQQRERWVAAAADLAILHGVDSQQLLGSLPVWQDVAHALMNTKEFIYIQ